MTTPHLAADYMRCEKCGQQWEYAITLPMDVAAAALIFRGLAKAGCPYCGEKKRVYMGQAGAQS